MTANTNRAPEMAKRWPNLSFWLGLPSEIVDGLVETLAKLRKDGKIGNKVAMVSVVRPVRHRAVDRGARGLEEGRLRARL